MSEFAVYNDIVDEVGKLNITGNVVPENWYHTIITEDDKPYFLAIAILADIVNGYQSAKIEDKEIESVLKYKKEFVDGILRRNYIRYEEIFGVSHSTIKRAIVALEKQGIIKREFRIVVGEEERRMNNVMFIRLDVESLKRATYPKELPERHYGKAYKEKEVRNEKRLVQDVKQFEQKVTSELNMSLSQQAMELEEVFITDVEEEKSIEQIEAEIPMLFEKLCDESSNVGHKENCCTDVTLKAVVANVNEREDKGERVQQCFAVGIPFRDDYGNEQKIKMNIKVAIE